MPSLPEAHCSNEFYWRLSARHIYCYLK
jgi:hypothetical protein